MKEADIQEKLKRLLLEEEFAEGLAIGCEDPRWVKIPDSIAGSGRQRFIPFKGADLVWVRDVCEVKMVKAKTTRGMVLRTGKDQAIRERQKEYLREHNGLIAVGFVVKGEPDRLAMIAVARWREIEARAVHGGDRLSIQDFEKHEEIAPCYCITRKYRGYDSLISQTK